MVLACSMRPSGNEKFVSRRAAAKVSKGPGGRLVATVWLGVRRASTCQKLNVTLRFGWVKSGASNGSCVTVSVPTRRYVPHRRGADRCHASPKTNST
jgi:hypothetical protein